MRRHKSKHAERMRLMVDCLPYETRIAMLDGLERYEIIAGAYSDRSGGVCPMLAAHRCGGRTDFRGFARTWDRFTGAGRARRASERELRTLTAQLEQSIWNEDRTRYALTRLDEGKAPARKQPARRASELGAAWLIPARGWDDYRRTLELALEQAGEPLPELPDELERDARRSSPQQVPVG
jgi:hypothetical protein